MKTGTMDLLSARRIRFSTVLIVACIATALGAGAQVSSTPLLTLQEALYGDEDNQLRWPVAVATAGDDEIAVADAFGARLLLFKDQGGTIGWRLAAVAQLPSPPVGLSFDGERFVVSMRGDEDLLVAERPQLRFRQIGLPAGTIPGALAATLDGRVLVFDFASETILVLLPAGDLETSVPIGALVTSVATASSGTFFVSTINPGEIHQYSMAGNLLGSWPVPGFGGVPSWPVGLVSRTGGEVVVADRHGNRVVVLESGGQLAGTGSRQGWVAGLLRHPSDIAMLVDGRVVVADQGNGRIQIFRPVE